MKIKKITAFLVGLSLSITFTTEIFAGKFRFKPPSRDDTREAPPQTRIAPKRQSHAVNKQNSHPLVSQRQQRETVSSKPLRRVTSRHQQLENISPRVQNRSAKSSQTVTSRPDNTSTRTQNRSARPSRTVTSRHTRSENISPKVQNRSARPSRTVTSRHTRLENTSLKKQNTSQTIMRNSAVNTPSMKEMLAARRRNTVVRQAPRR